MIKKWFQNKKNQLTMTQNTHHDIIDRNENLFMYQKESINKKKPSRKERYVKRYLNNEQSYAFWLRLSTSNILQLRSDEFEKHNLLRNSIYYNKHCKIYLAQKSQVEPFSLNFSQRFGLDDQLCDQTFLEEFAFNNQIQEQLLEMIIHREENLQYQSIPLTKSPIIAIFSVGFHHKKGSQIEYSFPPLEEIQQLFETQANLEDALNKVTVYSLPDAVHNLNEDYLYFNFNAKIRKYENQPAQQRMIFAVAYFKQIKVTDQMRKFDPELTRSHIQKAICMISFEPLFGYIKKRLEPTTKAYFSLEIFKDTSLIQFAFQNIEQVIDYQKGLQDIDLAEIYAGVSPKALFIVFKEKIFKILKAIILEKRIIIFSLTSSLLTNFIVSLLSLLPSTLFFTLKTDFTYLYQNYCSDHGWPLRIFHAENPLYLYFTVNDLPEILDCKPLPKGYLIGTTNKFIKTLNKLQADLIVDLDAEEIIETEEIKSLLKVKVYEKQVYENIRKASNSFKNIDAQQREAYKRFKINEEPTPFVEGSESWIRRFIHSHMMQLHCEVSFFYQKLKQFDEEIFKVSTIQNRKSVLLKQDMIKEIEQIQQQQQHSSELSNSSNEEDEIEQEDTVQELNLDENLKKTKEELLKQYSVREIRVLINETVKILSKFNRKFVLEWLTNTLNGRFWIQHHWNQIANYAENNTNDLSKLQVISYPNGDIFVGRFISNYKKVGMLVETLKQFIYVGEFENGLKHGQGRYEEMLNRSWSYIGSFSNGMRNGKGKYVVQEKLSYDGTFENDQYSGFGNLQMKENQIYEGQFLEGKYHGTGKLVMPSQDVYVGQFSQGNFDGDGQYVWKTGDIYKGSWKKGFKHGLGLLQTQDEIYEGEWEMDIKQGYGSLTKLTDHTTYQGQFINGKLEQKDRVIIKYQDETVYQGFILDWKPHGEGYMAYKDGTILSGLFENGLFLKELGAEYLNEIIQTDDNQILPTKKQIDPS